MNISFGIFLTLILCLLGCKSIEKNPAGVKTDLGPAGNAAVVKTFREYVKKTQHCDSGGASKRAMITGFGLFSGASFNISGTIADSMASKKFLPEKLDLSHAEPASTAEVQPGKIDESEFGGRASQRTIQINGVSYELCFIVLDVKWDQAAAIILFEAERFQPDLIVMSGRGGSSKAHFEGGAVNRTNGGSGYDSDGTSNPDNTALSSYILKNHAGSPAKDEIAMTWNASLLARNTSLLVESISPEFSVFAEPSARPSNDYICNNTSYVILHALNGFQARLAGETLEVSSTLTKTKAGFFHYPLTSSNDKVSVWGWSKVMAKIVTTSLP